MKVYVDELPKDCWSCPMHDGENGWCKMLVCYTDYIPKDCPLQSLSDYTKQVRKEVCDGLALLLIKHFQKDAEFTVEEICEWIQKYKDQLQGENND